nr:hypothetical protein [uncultured Brevundimonas sp.]
MPDRIMSGRRRFAWLSPLVTLAIAVLIGWGCVIGAREVLQGLDVGMLNNRRGPDVYLVERPVIFWALIVFYTTAVVVSAGMAVLLAAIAVRSLFGRRA